MTEVVRGAGTLLVVAVIALGCGRKAAVRPPEDVQPQPIASLSATTTKAGVVLRWNRPLAYMDGTRLRDLGGFEIWRLGPESGDAFSRIGKLSVDDRQRFQQAKRFSFVDKATVPGKLYQYYVVSFTIDDYFSGPSNLITLTFEPPPEAETPVKE